MQAILKILAQADARLGTHDSHWQSLGPGRERATSLSAIGERVLGFRTPDALALAWSRGFVDVAIAMRDAFPENLFWDLDHLAASLLSAGADPDLDGAQDPERGAARITEHAARLVRVQHVFGRHTPVAFRYVHDFSYGFDWAKWVAKGPAARGSTPPFAATFVEAMIARGHELHALIAAGSDPKYPPLPGGEARNPFGFSREPPAEARLMRHLAERDLLPVRAWDGAHVPRWDRPYAALRRQAAHALGV